MLCARRANHRRLRISATKEQHVLRLKKLDIDYILSVSDEIDRHPLVTRPQRRRPGQMLGATWETVREIFSAHNYCLSPRWQTEFIQRPFYANKISSEMQIFIVFLSRVNLSIFLSDFLHAQPQSRKIVGTMFINCVPFQLILSFRIIIFNLKCCDTVYQLKCSVSKQN